MLKQKMEEHRIANNNISPEFLQGEYILHLLRQGKPPVTVFSFCEKIGIEEQEFYTFYNSFKTLEAAIWKGLFFRAIEAVQQDEEFENFTTQEKMLSFYYTIIEVFKQNRSFITLKLENISRKDLRPKVLKPFREEFQKWTEDIINKGLETEELATRPLLSDQYTEALWVQFLYITRVWINDESSEFEITDAAIEKTTALLFELMKKGPVDLLIDFLKFAYQNKAY